jgi:hypothetical protein
MLPIQEHDEGTMARWPVIGQTGNGGQRFRRPGQGHGRVKRIGGIDTILQQANRALDPLTGRLFDQRPGFDPRLLIDPSTPIAPWVEQLIVATVNEAIALDLPMLDALERLAASLTHSGIVVSVDDLRWLVGSGAEFGTPALAT